MTTDFAARSSLARMAARRSRSFCASAALGFDLGVVLGRDHGSLGDIEFGLPRGFGVFGG